MIKKNALLSILTISVAAALTPAAAYAEPKSVVKVAAQAALRLLDPIATTAYVTRNHGYMVYDTLFALDSNLKPQPQMVDTWEVSDDSLVYTFTLRDGLKFHDGTPVTSADCIASIKRWAERDLVGVRMMASTKELVAVDDKTFQIILEKPFGAVIDGLSKASSLPAFIMPERLASQPASEPVTEIIGSGPFIFNNDEYRPGLQVVYDRNPDYAPRSEPADGLAGGKVVKVDRVTWLSLPDIQTEANALIAGEVDYIEIVYPDVMGMLQNADNVKVQRLSSTTTPTLRMNWQQPPFNNKLVRQALLHSVSQTDFMDAQIGDPNAYTICGALFGCDTALATDVGAVQTAVEPNYERARELLKESGYTNQKTVVLHATDYPPVSAIAPMAVQALQTIGMNVEMQAMDWATLLTRRNSQEPVEKGGWSLAYGSWNTLDLLSPLSNLNLDGRGKVGYAGWSESEEMEELKNKFAAATDPEERRAIAEQIQALAYDEVFYIPLGTYYDYAAHRENVSPLLEAPVVVFWGIEKHDK